ncbi:MAG TPA: Hpt domain-containing protein, partial [Rhodanobacteraceae bacterium]|nr:Hpt domain-containing protein [Rhodanobacteraceae bacterium]
MQLEEHIDFSTLGWVKPQIDQLLSEARQALEAYAEDPEDARLMQSCVGLLHQVLGTLRMVELYGAAELDQEMEHLAQSVLDGKVADRDEALGALMRGVVQLPDYLDLIESGHKDIPIVLLPLLNELRDARGAEAVDQRVLFHPDIDRPLPPEAAGARVAYPFADLRARTTQVRGRFQVQLLAWTQGKQPNFADMRDCMDELRAACHAEAARRLWWVAGGVLEALQQGRLDHHLASLRQQFGQLDRTIRHMQDQGEEVCGDEDARELVRGLLFSVAHATPGPGRTEAIAQCFALDRMVPSAEELERARAAMSGRNRALLDTVAKAVREDLLRVKEGLDIFLRRDDRSPQQLAPQVETLHRVGDTLGMLGLESPARMIGDQRKVIADVIDGKREAKPEVILDVASALLYVDASLDEHIEFLGATNSSDDVLPSSEARKIMRTLMREAGANLGRVKEHITAFIESSWSHVQLADVPKLLAEVSGALRILNLERPAELVDGIDRYIGNELIADGKVPTVDEMDTLADAMASVEYYLEIGRDSSASDNRILDAAQHSLEKLQYWPLPARREPAEPAVIEDAVPATETATIAPASIPPIGKGVPIAVDIPVAAANDTEAAQAGYAMPGVGPGQWIDVEEEVLEPAEADGAAPVDTAFQDAAGIDEEIREVFVEEVGEEIANINVNLPAWKANPDDLDTLKNVRRSFHTLKGSGRLVGAAALGEFSWKIENMLNRVLDRTIQPDQNVQDVVDAAVATLPKLHAGLQGQPVTLDPPLDAIMQTADKLVAGEPARIADLIQGYRKTVRTVRRWVPDAEAGPAAVAPVTTTAQVITSPETGLPVVDPILLDVLRTEVGQHLDNLRAYLARNIDYRVPADDELMRSVHTLHGAVAMVGIEMLANMLAPMESWVRRVRSAEAPLDREGCDAMRDAVAMTDHVMAQFDAPVPDVPDTTALAERLEALRDRWPEAAPFGAPRVSIAELELEAEAGLALEDEPDDGVTAIGLAAVSTLPTEDDADALAAREEADRLAAEKAERERIAAEHAEAERLAEQAEQERIAPEQAESEQVAAEQAEQERVAAEQAEAERAAAEQAEQERVATEQAEQDRLAAVHAEQERMAAEQAEQARLAAEAERAAAERAEIERLAAEQAEQARLAAEQAERERVAAEQAEQERLAAEQAERDRIAAEEAERERIAAEQVEAERIAAARAQAERDIAAAALPAFPEDAQPDGALDIPGLDPELVSLFTEEGGELLDSSDSLMAILRNAPDDAECIRGLQRNLHTLKGGARVVGIAAVGDLAHAMETLLEKIGDRKRVVEPIEVDSLERAFDRLHDMVERVVENRAVATPVNAVERFNALAEGRPITGMAGAVATPQSESAAEHREAPVAKAVPAPPPRVAPQFVETEVQAPAELIRVRSDLLDSLVNAAGEASIYRARLEQQVGNFRFNLIELNQTVARLREQLRKLEIETETQILSRYQRENEAGEGATFDPLELDRFSNLQQYSRALAESVSDLASIQDILDDQARQSETLLLQQSRVNSDLQDGLMRTRMVPFESMVPNLRRTLRGAADELGKRAQLRVEGAQGEMDRSVMERMKAPFEHMLRNALAHGIEDPAQRVAIGKPMEGTVTIHVGRQGTEVLVRVTDDGAGFDRDAIRRKAIERGLLQADMPVSDAELFNFVLQTGFSTASEVSQIAGRGVGMDVVANEIRQLGGSLTIESERGRGTTFNIRLPFTLAVTQAITV